MAEKTLLRKEAPKKAAAEKPVAKQDPAAEKADVKRKPEARKKSATSEKVEKTDVKKKPAVKKEIKVNTVIEHQGKQVEEKNIISAVKKAWTRSGKKVGDIKTMDVYIKPEEDAVYYVINGSNAGSVPF